VSLIRTTHNLTGVLVLDKPAGPTSFEVVRRIKQALGARKIGHTGTLDPLATGVLTVCLGRATKLVPFLQKGEKAYEGRLLLGLVTETDDLTGRVMAKRAIAGLEADAILAAAREFVGLIEQVPSAYSALKYGGRPAYQLARRGEKVPARSRLVTIHELNITAVDLPWVSFYARVGPGAYIRSLVSDLGRRLRTGATLVSLRRVASGPFSVGDTLSLEEAESLARQGRLARRILTLEQALSFMPEITVPADLARLVENGQPLSLSHLPHYQPRPGPIRILSGEAGLLAVYEYRPRPGAHRHDLLTPLRVLGRTEAL
jgi:tRNA pseudouridine55 synthase